MRFPVLLLVVPSLACGMPEAGSSSSSTSSSSSGSVAPPCGLVDAPVDLTVSEGGRLVVTLATEPEDAVLTVLSAPEGIRTSLDGKVLKVKPVYGKTGAQDISLHLACGATQKDFTLALMVRALKWTSTPSWNQGTTGPLAREYGSMWMDAEDPDRLLVFGGYHYVPTQFTTSWDGWSLNLTTGTWTELTMANEPPHLPGGRMLPLPGTRKAYFYGGVTDDHDTPYSLKEFDYAPSSLSWSEVSSSTAYAHGDYQAAFILDAPRGRFLTLCGVNGSMGYHCDINAFYEVAGSAGSWFPLTPASGEKPQGRNGFFSVHDVETERYIMFSGDMGGGGAGDMAQDLWALELAEDPVRWVKLSDGDPNVIGRRNGATMLDPINHRMFIWGGTPNGMTTTAGLFALDLDRGEEHWDHVVVDGEPVVRTSGMAVYDSARKRMMVGFGNGQAVYADLWALEL